MSPIYTYSSILHPQTYSHSNCTWSCEDETFRSKQSSNKWFEWRLRQTPDIGECSGNGGLGGASQRILSNRIRKSFSNLNLLMMSFGGGGDGGIEKY